MENLTEKAYLGDSVYVARDLTDAIVLTTENDGYASNVIVLEPDVIENLLFYLKVKS